jgi:hypothetical protein
VFSKKKGVIWEKTLTVCLAASARLGRIKVTAIGGQTRALHVLLSGTLALALGPRPVPFPGATCPQGTLRRRPGVTAV